MQLPETRVRSLPKVEAVLYERLEEGQVRCHLCAHRCRIVPGRAGICGVRVNLDGTLYSINYGRLTAAHVDPIEKKPLFHFHPGTPVFSIAAPGCNFQCAFCQNWEISQMIREFGDLRADYASPEAIVEAAVRSGSRGIAYTYTEPTIFAEYALETMELARSRGLYNVFVSNGYQTPEAIERFAPYLDAINIDLKAFNERYYLKVCKAKLEPVLEAIRLFHEAGVWTEVTTLVVPGENDGEEELGQIAEFLASISVDIPWHISRFHPDYKMTDHPPTPTETLERAARLGREAGLRYVYTGNVPGHPLEHTYCPGCGRPVIERYGFFITGWHLEEGRCAACSTAIAGVGLEAPPPRRRPFWG